MSIAQYITPKTFRTTIIIVVVLVVVILTAFQARFFLFGPQIILSQSVISSEQQNITVSFMVENSNFVSVAQREIIPTQSGLVQAQLYLQTGLNVVPIVATDTYGSTEKEYLYITYPQ